MYAFSVAAFLLYWQYWAVATKIIWSYKPKTLTISSFTGKFANSCSASSFWMLFLNVKESKRAIKYTFKAQTALNSDFLVSWGNTDLGSFIINLARNECFDFWHTINQRGQTISLNAPLEVLQFFGYCSVSCTSIMLTARLVKLKLELISIIKRSLHRDEPAASFKMLITLTPFSNINKRSYFVF